MNFVRLEYLFRPSQIARRIAYGLGVTKNRTCAKTPWGLPIHFAPDELHGRAMLTLGLSDLRTNEIISRLLRPGDIAIDIGANIGIMTSLMARRAGPTGAVYAFEPHPDTRRRLEANIDSWAATCLPVAPVTVIPSAVSDQSGSSTLVEPEQFSRNSGIATLQQVGSSKGNEQTSRIDVSTIKFDEWAENLHDIRLVKIDVEGHEDSVLKGMQRCLADKRVYAFVFEEMRPLPSPATETLKEHGYSCYMIDRTFWKPLLISVEGGPNKIHGEATNILAIRDERNIKELEKLTWSCLK